MGLHKSFLWKDNSSFLACVCCYLTFSDDAWFWLYVITVLMEINTGNSVHHLDYRKNYMFSHTAVTIKKKKSQNFIFRQNLKERHGDSNISKFSQQIWKGTCGFSIVFLPTLHTIVTIHNAEWHSLLWKRIFTAHILSASHKFVVTTICFGVRHTLVHSQIPLLITWLTCSLSLSLLVYKIEAIILHLTKGRILWDHIQLKAFTQWL